MTNIACYTTRGEEHRGGAAVAPEPEITSALAPEPAAEEHEPLTGPTGGWLIPLFVVFTLVTCVGLLAIYIGVQYAVPSWGAHAYPPPIYR